MKVSQEPNRIEIVAGEKFIPYSILILFYDKLLDNFSIHTYTLQKIQKIDPRSSRQNQFSIYKRRETQEYDQIQLEVVDL